MTHAAMHAAHIASHFRKDFMIQHSWQAIRLVILVIVFANKKRLEHGHQRYK
jgi:hypothetical protein